MTTYSFAPSSSTGSLYWDVASNWSLRAVPNSGQAIVVFPEIWDNQTQTAFYYQVAIQSGETYQVSEADFSNGTLSNNGTLSVLNAVTVGQAGGIFGTGGTLTAASLVNDGSLGGTEQITFSGELFNRGSIGGNLAISAATFANAGTLSGTGLTLSVTSGGSGFLNLSNGILTGGTYWALTIDVNDPITTLAATVYGGGGLQTYAASGTSFVPLTSSLATIAPSGLLELPGNSYANVNALTVQGEVALGGYAPVLSAPSLTIAAGGTVSASSFGNVATISASGGIVDNGAIFAGISPETNGGYAYKNSSVLISAAVTGSGNLVIGPSEDYYNLGIGPQKPVTVAVTLELSAADSANVIFADTTGTLQLDAPQSFTGTIKSFAKGDSIVLSGVSLSSVLSTSYSGDSTHGVLTLVESGGIIKLAFQGNYTASSFSFAAGTQQLSTSPASIIITDSVAGASPNEMAAAAIAAPQAGTVVVDTSGDVALNLDGLQALKAAGDLSAIVLTDLTANYLPIEIAIMKLTATQFLNDSGALSLVAGAYEIDVTGATALQAEGIAGGSHVAAVAITDSAANVAAQIDQLGALAATGQVSSIALTDSAFVPITVSSTQFAADRTAFEDITGHYVLSVNATAANATVQGITGIGATVAFSGTASEYSLTTQGDGVGLTVTDTGTGRTSTDSLRTITAVKFSDVTDFVAQTPGGGGAGTVTTGNVTELYGAVFGRLPDVPGLAYYQGVLAGNPTLPLTTFAQWFLASPEYTGNSAHNYAQSSTGDSQFITDCYQNLLHRAPETGAIPYYLTIIDTFTNGLTPGTAAYAAAQTLGHAYVLTDFSASAEFLADVQVTAQNPSSAQHWLILI